MKRHFAHRMLSVALALCLPLVALANPAPAAAEPPIPLMWRACDSDNCVYMLGSFHLLRAEDRQLADEVERVFSRAGQVMFEIDPREMNSPETVGKMAQAAISRTPVKRPAELEARLQALLKKHGEVLRNFGITEQTLPHFQTWFVAISISLLDLEKNGMHGKFGLDNQLGERALAAGKQVAGLETIDAQLAVFSQMANEEAWQMLDEALDELDTGNSTLLYQYWRQGDAEGLWQETIEPMQRDYPALYRRVNIDRNQAWLPKIAAHLDETSGEDVMVVVGAMHLLGADGLVEGLRVRGYRIERVCESCPSP